MSFGYVWSARGRLLKIPGGQPRVGSTPAPGIVAVRAGSVLRVLLDFAIGYFFVSHATVSHEDLDQLTDIDRLLWWRDAMAGQGINGAENGSRLHDAGERDGRAAFSFEVTPTAVSRNQVTPLLSCNPIRFSNFVNRGSVRRGSHPGQTRRSSSPSRSSYARSNHRNASSSSPRNA